MTLMLITINGWESFQSGTMNSPLLVAVSYISVPLCQEIEKGLGTADNRFKAAQLTSRITSPHFDSTIEGRRIQCQIESAMAAAISEAEGMDPITLEKPCDDRLAEMGLSDQNQVRGLKESRNLGNS